MKSLALRIQGLGIRVWVLEFRLKGVEFKARSLRV